MVLQNNGERTSFSIKGAGHLDFHIPKQHSYTSIPCVKSNNKASSKNVAKCLNEFRVAKQVRKRRKINEKIVILDYIKNFSSKYNTKGLKGGGWGKVGVTKRKKIFENTYNH